MTWRHKCFKLGYKKVKCTPVQALRLCTGRTAPRGSRGIPLLFLDRGTRREWGVSVTHRPLFTPMKDPVPIVQEAGWFPGPVWTGAENLAPTGIWSPDRPAHSQSLYRLRYPVHRPIYIYIYIYIYIRLSLERTVCTRISQFVAKSLEHVNSLRIHSSNIAAGKGCKTYHINKEPSGTQHT
jgi:hypothetical protein